MRCALRTVVTVVAVALTAAGCGAGGAGGVPEGAPSASTPSTAASASTAPGGSGGTSAPAGTPASTVDATSAGPAGGTTSPATATSLPLLQEYLRRVAAMDAELRRVGRLVNADITATGIRPRPETRQAIDASREHILGVGRAIPAGMSTALTRASMLVFSNLAARTAAFHGVPWSPVSVSDGNYPNMLACLRNGNRAAARFAADVAALRRLAASSPAFTPARPSSRAAAEIALQTRWAWAGMACCDSCGGPVSDRLAPIVWHPRRASGNGPSDGTINGVDFSATYHVAGGWAVEIYAG